MANNKPSVQFGELEKLADSVINEIKSKTIVMFVPTDRWRGEFGFDWMRIGKGTSIGQSNTPYDIDYNTIMGYYKDNNPSNTFIFDSDKNSDGVKDMYAELKKEYTPMLLTYKKDSGGNPLEYYVPILRIYRHPNDNTGIKPIASIKLQIEVLDEEPDSIVLEYDSTCLRLHQVPNKISSSVLPLSLSTSTTNVQKCLKYNGITDGEDEIKKNESSSLPHSVDSMSLNNHIGKETDKNERLSDVKRRFRIPKKSITTLNNPHILEIDIECVENFSQPKEIKAISIKKDTQTGENIETLSGKIKVMPNSRNNRKIKKIVLVNVIKKDTMGLVKEGFDRFTKDDQKNIVRNILRQAFVDPIFECVNLRVDNLSSSNISIFNKNYLKNSGVLCCSDKITDRLETVDQFLRKQLPATFQNTQYTCIFYLNFRLISKNTDGTTSNMKGYSNKTNRNIIMGIDADDSTPAHEILHDLKLEHIFEYKSQLLGGRQIPKAKHCFKQSKTKSIMDYCKEERYFMYNWQAIIVNGAASAEPLDYIPQ